MSIADIVGYQIARANLASLDHFERAVSGPFKLRPVEYTIMQLVREGRCNTLSQLAKELQMAPPSVSVWLDKLSVRCLLKRSKADADGRVQQLLLTESGHDLCLRAHEALLTSQDQLLAGLSAGERTMLFETLSKVGAKPVAA